MALMKRGRKKNCEQSIWTCFEERFLIQNAHLGAPLLAFYLGKSQYAITMKAYKLKVSLGAPRSISNPMPRPKCRMCNERPCQSKGKTKAGKVRWDRLCHKCKARPYSIHKKAYCEHCGFKAVNPRQLDVDHADGDSTNNDPDNLITLCANCHRLKTFVFQSLGRNG